MRTTLRRRVGRLDEDAPTMRQLLTFFGLEFPLVLLDKRPNLVAEVQ